MKHLICIIAILSCFNSYSSSIAPCEQDYGTAREIGEHYPEEIFDLENEQGQVVGAITINRFLLEVEALFLCGDNPNVFLGSGGHIIKDLWNNRDITGIMRLSKNTLYEEAYTISGSSYGSEYRGSNLYFDFALRIAPLKGSKSNFENFETGRLTLKISRDVLHL